ncbi:phosphatidylinositol mannoside acyltransferase [Arcanobacterium canis]
MKIVVSAKVFERATRAARVIPEPLGRFTARMIGSALGWSTLVSVRQLRINLQRIRSLNGSWAQYVRSGKAMSLYMTYYYEIFRLPHLTREQVDARVRVSGKEKLTAYLDRGKALPAALLHMGNWDLAGAWASWNLAPVHTLAEKLNPPEVADYFLQLRRQMGMTIYHGVKGQGAIHALETDMNDTVFVPLLCDRDLSAQGIEVNLLGHPIRVAVGSALLARQHQVPMFPVFIETEHITEPERRRRAGTTSGIHIHIGEPIFPHPEVELSADLERMNQEWMDAVGEYLPGREENWHMLQKVFVEDLDRERLAKRHVKEEENR